MLLIVSLVLSMPLLFYSLWQCFGILGSAYWIRYERACYGGLQPASAATRLAVLYVTCDDFDPAACETLLVQDGICCDVFILDDSTKTAYREQIDIWQRCQTNVIVVRREDRIGFKGGNINHWVERFATDGKYPFFLIVDADESLPRNFAARIVQLQQVTERAFIQAAHRGTASLTTPFQRLMHLQVACTWFFSVPARQVFGTANLLGHGVLVRTADFIEAGKFPDIVSEDLALTARLLSKGYTGLNSTSVIGEESFPATYWAYWRRRLRWIQADAEVCRRMLGVIWASRASWRARADLTARELRLPSGSFGTLLLLILACCPMSNMDFHVKVPSGLLFLLLLIIAPVIPAILLEAPLWNRCAYILFGPFIGATTLGLHIPATVRGLVSSVEFVPTSSQSVSRRSRWDYVMALAFSVVLSSVLMIGGFSGVNLTLVAIGLAIGISPVLCATRNAWLLILACATFWGLLVAVGWQAVANGSVPIEHLLPLLALSIALE